MINMADNSGQALTQCAGWEFHRFTDGLLFLLLTHVSLMPLA